MLVGIDLGTTNSLIGFWRDGAVTLVPNSLGHLLTPSAVGFGDDGKVLVGLAARERLVSHPTMTAAFFKRYMGTNRLHFLGDRGYRPEELSALVLGSLKADAEAILGEAVEEAVITVPAYFNDAQRKATRAAGELAGLKVNRLLTEPTAAALAYGLETTEGESTILVVDLGGGTFDVSVLQCFEGVMEVRACAGDSWLGGEDFVDALIGEFVAEIGGRRTLPSLEANPVFHGALRRQAEIMKRRLSEADTASIEVSHDDAMLQWTRTREQFERLAEPILARLRAPIERALRDSRIAPQDLTQIVLAGGASRMPMFRRLISRLFQRLPVQSINPDEVVARGAAVRAGLAMRDRTLEEVVLTDVAPFTLGIEVAHRDENGHVADGVFLPVIERNTVIPTSRMRTVRPIEDNQTELRITVYQGESRFVRDNIRLGDFVIAIPRGPAGKESVDVRFTYDTSGLLEVEARVQSNRHRCTLVIEGNSGVLTAAQIKARLAELGKLKVHPRDQAENQAVIARAKRLYEERLGATRHAIDEWLARFVTALETQDEAEIAAARERLDGKLDSIDDQFFL